MPDADLDGVTARLDDAGERDAEQQRERRRDRDRRPERHLVGVAGRVEEHQRADHERHGACERERAVADDERLRHEEPRSESSSSRTPATETGSTWSP